MTGRFLKFKKIFLAVLLFFALCAPISIVMAATEKIVQPQKKQTEQKDVILNLSSSTKDLLNTADSKNELVKNGSINFSQNNGTRPIALLIQIIYKYAIGVIGIFATLAMMVGGFIWLTAGGDSGKVNQAKKIIFNSIKGVILLLLAFTILGTINTDLVNLKVTPVNKVPGSAEKNYTIEIETCKAGEIPITVDGSTTGDGAITGSGKCIEKCGAGATIKNTSTRQINGSINSYRTNEDGTPKTSLDYCCTCKTDEGPVGCCLHKANTTEKIYCKNMTKSLCETLTTQANGYTLERWDDQSRCSQDNNGLYYCLSNPSTPGVTETEN